VETAFASDGLLPTVVGLDRLSDAKERALGEAGGQLTRALDQPPPSFVRGKAGSGSRGRQTAPPLRSLSSPRVAPGGLSKKEKPRRYARGKYKEARVPDGRTPVQENTAALCAGKRVEGRGAERESPGRRPNPDREVCCGQHTVGNAVCSARDRRMNLFTGKAL
jgi:hypothetical protein